MNDDLYDWISGGRVWSRDHSDIRPSFTRVEPGAITLGPLVLPLSEERPTESVPSEVEHVKWFFGTANRYGYLVLTHIDPDLPLVLYEARKLAGAAHV